MTPVCATGSSDSPYTPGSRAVADAATPDHSGFEREVRDALAHLHDPGHLQSHFLNRFLKADASARPSSAGRALRQSLLDAVESLKPTADPPPSRHASRTYQILRLRYVEALEVSQVLDRLSLSESLYYLELQRAMEGVSAVLWERWGLGEESGVPERQAKRGNSGKVGWAAPDSRAARTEAKQELLTNLPLQLTSFVGREREMAEVRRLLGANRLLTLTGTGGCGKTRLALQVAAEVLAIRSEEYSDGVWLVELAPLTDPALVAQTVAFTLGLREVPGEPILTTAQRYLKPKHLLLVLDNCEHLLDTCAYLVEALLRACSQLRVLATSREMLGVAGEAVWRVPSMAAPDPRELPPLDELARYESVRLFVERVKLIHPDFAVMGQNGLAVAQICWRLDGFPLAIELAAASLAALSVEQVATRLSDRFRLLTGGSRTALRRQQTLRATIDWSYLLLSEPEKVLLRRLAVFAGGWSLEAAESVCEGEGIVSEDVLDLLSGLVRKSLVAVEERGAEDRYRLSETIRQYAAEKLSDPGESAAVRDRHRDWCLGLVGSLEAGGFVGSDCGVLLDQMEVEHDNLRAALAWCLETNPGAGLRLAAGQAPRQWAGVWALWLLRGYPTEGRRWLHDLLDAAPERTPTRSVALTAASWLAVDQGDVAEAESLAEEALAIARETGDRVSTAVALLSLAEAAALRDDYARARTLLEEARAIGLSVGVVDVAGRAMQGLGVVAFWEGDEQEAEARYEEALSLCCEGGAALIAAFVLANLGILAGFRGDHTRARACLEESIAILRKARALAALGVYLFNQGYFEGLAGSYARGVELLHESLRLLQRQGHGPRLAWALYYLGVVEVRCGLLARGVRLMAAGSGAGPSVWGAKRQRIEHEPEAALRAARAELGEEAFARAWAEGQAMSLEQAVEYALQDEDELQ